MVTALLTLDEVAALLRVEARHVRNLVLRGKLSAVNVALGRRPMWRFEMAEVDRFVRSSRECPPPDAESLSPMGRAAVAGRYPTFEDLRREVARRPKRPGRKTSLP